VGAGLANENNTGSGCPQPIQASIYVDYIYLDTEERRRMAQQSHEYLIEQTQYNEDKGISSFNNRIDLTFNHPVKELIWVVQPSIYTNCNLAAKVGLSTLQPFTYNGIVVPSPPAQVAVNYPNPVYEQWIQMNGQDRLDKRYGDYFNKVQPYQHHTGSFNKPINLINGDQTGAYMYSFALRPEEHQPSGTCNFSRIDTATLLIQLSGSTFITPDADLNWDVRVYAINYNILRVMSGMGGLAYSN